VHLTLFFNRFRPPRTGLKTGHYKEDATATPQWWRVFRLVFFSRQLLAASRGVNGLAEVELLASVSAFRAARDLGNIAT
jgi:hypothetical protein